MIHEGGINLAIYRVKAFNTLKIQKNQNAREALNGVPGG